MPDAKITSLDADTAPTADDLIVTVNDPAGTPANKKVTVGAVKGLGRNYQTDNSNSIANTAAPTGLIVQYGWGGVIGSGTNTTTDSVTFPSAFTTPLGVVVSPNGFYNTAAAPATIANFDSYFGAIGLGHDTKDISTTGFSVEFTRTTGTFGNTKYLGYSWIAWGV